MRPLFTLMPVLLTFVLPGCDGGSTFVRDGIVAELKSIEGKLNLPSIGPRNWNRMCVLGPYTTNKAAEVKLGFHWDAESLTGIEVRDDIYVLVFINDNRVEMHLEMPRHEQDLLHADRSCFDFDDANLYRDASGNWSTNRD